MWFLVQFYCFLKSSSAAASSNTMWSVVTCYMVYQVHYFDLQYRYYLILLDVLIIYCSVSFSNATLILRSSTGVVESKNLFVGLSSLASSSNKSLNLRIRYCVTF